MERTQEQKYDDEISPLIAKVIELCKQHKIPAVMHFDLGKDERYDHDETLYCTTTLIKEDWEPSEKTERVARAAAPERSSFAMLTVRDGAGNVVRMEAISGD